MIVVNKIWKFLYLTSAHVALLTVLNASVFYKILKVPLKLSLLPLSILFMSTWLIYIFDRISDNYKETPHTERHNYHLEHQYLLQLLGISQLFLVVCLVFFLPGQLIINGLALFSVILFYLVLKQKNKKFGKNKELLLIFIYIIGVILGPLTLCKSIFLSTWILVFMFFIVVIQNVLAYSWFEFVIEEKKDNIVNESTENKIRKFITFFGSINIFIFLLLFTGSIELTSKFAFSLCLVSIFISLTVANSERIKNQYRLIIDLLFLLLLIVFF